MNKVLRLDNGFLNWLISEIPIINLIFTKKATLKVQVYNEDNPLKVIRSMSTGVRVPRWWSKHLKIYAGISLDPDKEIADVSLLNKNGVDISIAFYNKGLRSFRRLNNFVIWRKDI